MSVEFEHFHDDDLDVSARRNPFEDRTEVLVLSGRHHCGWSDWRLAPGWKIPADHGGGFYSDQCPRCLGAAEWDEEWWPKSEFVSDDDDGNDSQLSTDRDRSANASSYDGGDAE